jgi:hypothetical protein
VEGLDGALDVIVVADVIHGFELLGAVLAFAESEEPAALAEAEKGTPLAESQQRTPLPKTEERAPLPKSETQNRQTIYQKMI